MLVKAVRRSLFVHFDHYLCTKFDVCPKLTIVVVYMILCEVCMIPYRFGAHVCHLLGICAFGKPCSAQPLLWVAYCSSVCCDALVLCESPIPKLVSTCI
jgi:hypothetical protein